MEIIQDPLQIQSPYSCTIGNFDGVHLGHLELVKAIQENQHLGVKSCVLTLRPHPALAKGNNQNGFLVQSYEQRESLFAQYGIDYLCWLDFDEIKNLQQHEFHSRYLSSSFLQTIVLGHDFHYGKNRLGNYLTLNQYAQEKNIICKQIPAFVSDEQVVSSSLLRKYLTNQNFKMFERLCLRPFRVKGQVVEGQKLGRTIGVPTANIEVPSEVMALPAGVYLIRQPFSREAQSLWGIANWGYRPSIKNSDPHRSLEVHFFTLGPLNLYGTMIEIDFLEFIRSEIKFDSLELLKNQIKSDIKLCQEKISSKKKFALIGADIQHSLSPKIYRDILGENLIFDLLDYSDWSKILDFKALISPYSGLNVTAPFKHQVAQEVQLDCEYSKKLQLCNTVKIDKDGVLRGILTDALALEIIFEKKLSLYNPDKIFILGDGAMASLVKLILKKKKFNRIEQISRRQNGPIENWPIQSEGSLLIVNTCARSFVYQGPIKATRCHFWTLNYAHKSQQNEINIMPQSITYDDGYEMLLLQAKESIQWLSQSR